LNVVAVVFSFLLFVVSSPGPSRATQAAEAQAMCPALETLNERD